jgi:pimeloyl-ACP methyl ester carboxylesterase
MNKPILSILLTIFTLATCYSQKRFITVDNAKICINTLGLENRQKNQPVIVFQSGMGTPMGNWDPILESVSKMAPLFTYDRPGIGESDPNEEMPTIKNVSDRLIKILNFLKIDPPYILVGHSLGGVYVRGFANYFPELLAGLVIIDPGDFTETQENKRQYFIDIGLADSYIDSLFRKFDKESIENKSKSTAPISIQNEGTVLEDLRNSDFKEINDSALPNIPVHILTGGRYDTPIRLRRTEYNDSLLFRSKMQHRSTRWINVIQSVDKGMFFYSTDAGHFVHRDDPELAISSIKIVLQDYYLLKSKK